MPAKIIPALNPNIHNAVPDPNDLDLGELAVNPFTGNLFIKREDGSVFSLMDRTEGHFAFIDESITALHNRTSSVRSSGTGESAFASGYGALVGESPSVRNSDKQVNKGLFTLRSLSADPASDKATPAVLEAYSYESVSYAGFQAYVHEGGYVMMKAESTNASINFCSDNGLSVGGSYYDSGATTPSLKSANAFNVTVSVDSSDTNRPATANTAFTGTVNVSGSEATLASATESGTKGDIRFDSGYIYVCVADNTWKRASLATF